MALAVILFLLIISPHKELQGESNNQALTIQKVLPSYLKVKTETKKPKPKPKLKLLKNQPSPYRFSYGNCTSFVASKKCITWKGNAGTWFYQAKKQGYAVGHKPKKGAVYVEDIGYYGHCSILVQVKKTKFKVIEMNCRGFNVISTRWTNWNTSSIGFIYSII